MSKKCTPLWREAHFQVKMYKAHHSRTTFGSCDVEKVHAVVARHFEVKMYKTHQVRPLLAVEMSKKCTPLWREAHFEVKMYKAHHSRTTFGSCDVEKVHAVVARSTFRSQNVQSTPLSDHFWKLRCRKSARRCGAKHISKSKCTKHTILGPLLEVEMSKKCTPLWREAHFEAKMYKTHHCRTTFGSSDLEKVHAVVARSTFPSQNVKNTRVRTTFSLRFTRLQYTPLHYTTLNYITLHYAPLHYITLHYIHYTTLHATTLQLHNYTPLHSTNTTLHSTTLNYTTLHYITLHSTTLHYIYTTLHYTTFHYTSLH